MASEEELKKISIRIANHSASRYNHGNWWGDDTDLGHLPERIVAELSVFEEETRSSVLDEIFTKIEELDNVHHEFAPKEKLTSNPAYQLMKEELRRGEKE